MRAAGGSVEHLSSGSGELRDQSSNLPENSQIKAWKVFSFQSFSGDFCCEAEATVSFVGGCGKKGGLGGVRAHWAEGGDVAENPQTEVGVRQLYIQRGGWRLGPLLKEQFTTWTAFKSESFISFPKEEADGEIL